MLKSGVFHPFDMVIFDDRIFWTDWGLYGVMMARISNDTEHRSIYHSEFVQPHGIGIIHPAFHRKGEAQNKIAFGLG